MRYLIVFAHPNPESFNHAILDTVINQLNSLGATVTVRDLYALNFNPCLGMADLAAYHAGKTPEDVKIEQQFINDADKIIFISPIWWGLLPAIMKGYFDRVFSVNYAYTILETGMTGLLGAKKFAMINTLGATHEEQERNHLTEAFNFIVDKGIFESCNSPLCFHRFFYGIDSVGEERRREMLEDVKKDIEKFVLDPNYCPFFG